ncbi:MAG: glycosyltransferase family 8 protein [Xenococcaceae cyanobacterium MO_188.B32]|nr:glycosyltransferase family 8 protein [Xenococcaceae cyanobacterium MO_188.B32]
MNLLFCFDDKYEQHFIVALTSVLLNNRIPIKVYLITNHISSQLKQTLDKLIESYEIDIHINFIDEKYIGDLKVSHHASLANYFRLFVDNLLPTEIDKILYLDSDLVVNGSLEGLYNLNIEQYYIAARGGITRNQKKRLDLQSDYYFSSGVMLINLQSWRKNKIGQQAIEFVKNNPNKIKLWDQDALNKIIDGNFLLLDKKWNSLVDLYEGMSEVNDKSIIIHFVGSLKPWHGWCTNPQKDFYWSYLRQSLYSHVHPEYPTSFKQIVAAIKSYKKTFLKI